MKRQKKEKKRLNLLMGHQGNFYFWPESLDCRQSRNCDARAECRYDKSREMFACACDQGFSGNGLTCRQDTGEGLIIYNVTSF